MSRRVDVVIETVEELENGVRIRRSIGSEELIYLDPFLMLDELYIQKPSGFPDHPHRGFEIVTYAIKGSFSHEDFCGHKGILTDGDVQWVTTGRGLVHSEFPHDDQLNHGFQLWVNLPQHLKMCAPSCQELKDAQVPRGSKSGVHVKVIAGESMGLKSPIVTRTPMIYLDFRLDANATFVQAVPTDWTAFIFIVSGTGKFGPDDERLEIKEKHSVIFSAGDSIAFRNDEQEQLHFLLLAGKPINEPIVQSGPFVMTTQEEIEKTFEDFAQCKNGFENGLNWRSQGS